MNIKTQLTVLFAFLICIVHSQDIEVKDTTIRIEKDIYTYNLVFEGYNQIINWDTIYKEQRARPTSFHIKNNTKDTLFFSQYKIQDAKLMWFPKKRYTTLLPNEVFIVDAKFTLTPTCHFKSFILNYKINGEQKKIIVKNEGCYKGKRLEKESVKKKAIPDKYYLSRLTDTIVYFQEGIFEYEFNFFAMRQAFVWDTINQLSGANDVRLYFRNNSSETIKVQRQLTSNNAIGWCGHKEGYVDVLPDSTYEIKVIYKHELGYKSVNLAIFGAKNGRGFSTKVKSWCIVVNANDSLLNLVNAPKINELSITTSETINGKNKKKKLIYTKYKEGYLVYESNFEDKVQTFDWDTVHVNSPLEKVVLNIKNTSSDTLFITNIISDSNTIKWIGKEQTKVPPNGFFEIGVNYKKQYGPFVSDVVLKYKQGKKRKRLLINSYGFVASSSIDLSRLIPPRVSSASINLDPTIPFRYNGQKVNKTNALGYKEGKWVYFYADGTVEKIDNFSNGNKKGKQYAYYPSGILFSLKDKDSIVDSYFHESGELHYEIRAYSKTIYSKNGIIISKEEQKKTIFYTTTGAYKGIRNQYKSEVLNAYNMVVSETFHSNEFIKKRVFYDGTSIEYSADVRESPVKMIKIDYYKRETIYHYTAGKITEKISPALNYNGVNQYHIYKGVFNNEELYNGNVSFYKNKGEYCFQHSVINGEEQADFIFNGIRYNITDSLGLKQGVWISNEQYSMQWRASSNAVIRKRINFLNGEVKDSSFTYSGKGELEYLYIRYKNKNSPTEIRYYKSGRINYKRYQIPKGKKDWLLYKTIFYKDDFSNSKYKQTNLDGSYFEYLNSKIIKRATPKSEFLPVRLDSDGPDGISQNENNSYTNSNLIKLPYTLTQGEFRQEHIYNGTIKRYDKNHKLIKTIRVINGKINGDRILVFKDDILEAQLIKKYDTDRNGYIQRSEAAKIQRLILPGFGIESAVDFSYFRKLESLHINDHIIEPAIFKNSTELLSAIKNATIIYTEPSKSRWDFVDPIEIHDFVAIGPSYKGGNEALALFIKNNLVYPQNDIKHKNKGTVYIQFVVNKDGSIEKIDVLRGVSQEIDKEAIRLIKLMPKWYPGEQAGEAVRVKFTLPIKFVLPLE